MENKIRLVWDFRGEDALKTAEHQLIHLVEFMKKENIPFLEHKTEKINAIKLNFSGNKNIKDRKKIVIAPPIKPPT